MGSFVSFAKFGIFSQKKEISLEFN